MPFQPVNLTDEELEQTSEKLQTTFGFPNIHAFQEQAGIASLQGRSCLLNLPTDAGKTAAALYAFFIPLVPWKY
jgi:Lhr-like helicase